jgi:cytochrome c biogenesis factor
VSPMVTWIWLGALVVVCGGLIALWPSPRTVSRRVSAAYAARVGREARVPV